jgi:hypothetical protein
VPPFLRDEGRDPGSQREGAHASVDWMAEVDDAYGGGFDCVFAGSGEVPRAR